MSCASLKDDHPFFFTQNHTSGGGLAKTLVVVDRRSSKTRHAGSLCLADHCYWTTSGYGPWRNGNLESTSSHVTRALANSLSVLWTRNSCSRSDKWEKMRPRMRELRLLSISGFHHRWYETRPKCCRFLREGGRVQIWAWCKEKSAQKVGRAIILDIRSVLVVVELITKNDKCI